uniref:SRI domain-containing protein n=1 Tax=Macrostomum lignano TaxID=282301 RepID=A0A1I8FJ99_9PLAT
MSECASDTDSSLSDDPSDSERIDIPAALRKCSHRTEVVRAARCKLQALKTAYEDEVAPIAEGAGQGYEEVRVQRRGQRCWRQFRVFVGSWRRRFFDCFFVFEKKRLRGSVRPTLRGSETSSFVDFDII